MSARSDAGRAAMRAAWCACAALAAWSPAGAFPPQARPEGTSRTAREKPPRRDQVWLRDARDGSIQVLSVIVIADELDVLTIELAGKQTELAAEAVVRVAWGVVPPSYEAGLDHARRGQLAAAVAQFRLAASDASARSVVRAAARLGAARALLRWGASDPARLPEAAEEVARFLESFAHSREAPQARALQARALWMCGKLAEAAETYRKLFGAAQPPRSGASCPRELGLEAGLCGARALLQLQPADTGSACFLFADVDQAATAALSSLEPASPARAALERLRDEARLGEGWLLLGQGKPGEARTFFEKQLAGDPVSDTTRRAATFGLARALAAEGELRAAQLRFAWVSALECVDRDRAADAQVGLAEVTLKLADPDAKARARAWLDAVARTQGDTLAAARARELLARL